MDINKLKNDLFISQNTGTVNADILDRMYLW